MDELQLIVTQVFEEKNTYKEGDYLVIMNILKDAYHILSGDFDSSSNTFKKDNESDAGSDDEEEDGLQSYSFRDSDSDADESYTGSYLPTY
tara:strand:+ start:35 stop:307 length:273 start_codon:yes stop_codon:yes gene_type:complete